MKKTYITNIPDDKGAFFGVSECFAKLGVNITRVSYNKAVDTHALFIDVEGDANRLERADEILAENGYFQKKDNAAEIFLTEFFLEDKPGAAKEIARLIYEYSFNISYISYQATDKKAQVFKVGILAEDKRKFSDFVREAGEICFVNIIEYNRAEKIFDNSIFYNSFTDSLISAGKINPEAKEEILINSNLAMQILDEKGKLPYKTFNNISKFAGMLANSRGDSFNVRITYHSAGETSKIILIEPPCGSNTAIIKSKEKYLFIDCGYTYYKEEMTKIYNELVPGFKNMKKQIILTHADVDHCGLAYMFDEIFVSCKTGECLKNEYEGKNGFREQNRYHKPYVKICKALTEYKPPRPEKLRFIWEDKKENALMWQIGFFDFGEFNFEVYECSGGHLPGETVLIDYKNRIAFTGDIYINLKDMTPEQKKYNRYAPKLMSSVDTDAGVCGDERKAIFQRLGGGKWQIFGSHGMKKEISVCFDEA